MGQYVPEWLNPEGPQSKVDLEVVRHLFLDSMPSSEVTIDTIERIAKRELVKRFLRKVSERRSCIEATFHGTYESHVQGILDRGFEPSACVRGLYGMGTYVGSHAGLAHKYTACNEHGQRRIFCVMVDAGPVGMGTNNKTFEHTTVDTMSSPEQYCFVDPSRLLASHLVTYRITGPGILAPALRSAVARAQERMFQGGKR